MDGVRAVRALYAWKSSIQSAYAAVLCDHLVAGLDPPLIHVGKKIPRPLCRQNASHDLWPYPIRPALLLTSPTAKRCMPLWM